MAKKVLDLNSVDVVWRNASEKFLRKDEIITSAEAYAAEEPAADVAYEKGELMFTFALPRGLQGIPGNPGKDGIGKDGDGVEYVYLLTNDNEVPGLYVPENFYEDNDYRQDEYLPYMSEEALEQGDVTKRWTDNYVAPSATMRYSWVAIRKSKDGIWQPFSDPKLWNIYKTAGKSFVDIYKRSDTLLDGSNLPQHSNPIYYKFSNDTFYSDLEATSELKSIGTGYNTWYHDIPSTHGRYLYRAAAYVDIIDLDHPVEISENAWMGPYFMSSNGEAIKTGYVTFDDDSFSLPIKENGYPWMDYNYSFNAYLWYGQDKLNINKIEVKDNSNGIEFNSNVIDDVATISFTISKDHIFNDLSYINVILSGEYEGEPITGSLQFKIIPFISEDGKFYKLLLSKDIILTPNEQTSEEDMNKWNDSVSIQVVDAKGNVINPNSINCKLYYTDDNGRDQEIVNGLLNFKSGESSQYNSYIDILDVPNPMVIKLVDDLNQIREVEYVNFIGTPLNGSDGISARTVFAFTSTTDGSKPATPQGGSVDFDTNIITYPDNWGDSNNLSGIVWMSQRDFYADGTKDTAWTIPIKITGEQGEPGTDGSSIEFIYRLCQSDLDIDEVVNNFDQYKNQDKSQIIGKDNWTDSPLGISIDNRIELCSTRSKSESTENTDGKWSEWCTPFIWSKWGEDGIDGDGVEYIFFISDKMNDELGYNKPSHPGTTLAMKREELSDDQKTIFDKYVNSFDFFPGQAWIDKQKPSASETEKVVLDMLDLGWTDDPQDVGPYEPVEFVSIRKKKVNPETNSITYEYTEPRIWSEWKRPGYDTYTEFIFAVHENLSGAIIEGGNYDNLDISKLETIINDEKVEVAWFDTLPQNNDPSKFIWMAKGFVSSEIIYTEKEDGSWEESYNQIDWSSPIKMIDSQYMQVDYTSTLNPGTPTSLEDIKGLYKDRDKFDITTLEGLEAAFRDYEMEANGVEWSDSPEDPIWMIVSTCNNGVWSDWSLSRIKGEKGDKGDAGTSVTIKGRFTTEENLKTAYEYYINPSGTKPNEYFNGDSLLTGDGYIVESTGDLWVYTEPFNPEDANFSTDWMNVGQVKGDSFYIYTIYASDRTDNGYILTGDAAPFGKTPGKWFGMYITEQKIDDSVVDSWYSSETIINGGPFNWSKWVGEDGFGQEQIFILGKDPGSAPDIPQWTEGSGVSKDTWNTQDYVPAGWSDTPLTPTLSDKCCWMAVRKYPYDGEDANQFHGVADTNGIITINDKKYSNKAILFSQIGESPYHVELSNEYDQIYVGEDLKTNVDQTFVTTYKIFKGTEEYNGEVGIEINGESGLDFDTNISEKTISITVKNGADLTGFDKLVFDIQFDILDEYNLSKNFRLVRLNSVMDYDLKVTPTYIKIDKDGNYSASEVTCKISAKTIGLNSSIEELDKVPEGYVLKTYNNGELDQTINSQGDLPTIESNDIVNNYKFELVKDEIIVDEVIVEILSDGQDGKPGEDGEPGLPGVAGATGAMIYPAGEWKYDVTYINDGNSAPYVLYNEDYFILKTEGEYINEIPTNSDHWMQMAEFEAIYAKVGVINHGLIGSAVFYGDWMFSQYGYDSVGNSLQDEDSYKKFGQDINGDIMSDLSVDNLYGSNSAFKPMTALNFKNGAGAFAGGQIHWDANGNLYLPPMGTLTTYYKTDFTSEIQTLYANISIITGNSLMSEVTAEVKLYQYSGDEFIPNENTPYEIKALGGSSGNGTVKTPYSSTIKIGENPGKIPTHVALYVNNYPLCIGVVSEEEDYVTISWGLYDSSYSNKFRVIIFDDLTTLYDENGDTTSYKIVKYDKTSGSTNLRWSEINDSKYCFCILAEETNGQESQGVYYLRYKDTGDYIQEDMLYNNHQQIPGSTGYDDPMISTSYNLYLDENQTNKYSDPVINYDLASSKTYIYDINNIGQPYSVSVVRKYWWQERGAIIRFTNQSENYAAYFEFGPNQIDSLGTNPKIKVQIDGTDLSENDIFLLQPGSTIIFENIDLPSTTGIVEWNENLYITLGENNGNYNSDPQNGWIPEGLDYVHLKYNDSSWATKLDNHGYYISGNSSQNHNHNGGYIRLEDLYAENMIIEISD